MAVNFFMTAGLQKEERTEAEDEAAEAYVLANQVLYICGKTQTYIPESEGSREHH